MTEDRYVVVSDFEDSSKREGPTGQADQLIDAAMALFVQEYGRHARPDYDDAEHDDCVRAALEAVIALVQGGQTQRTDDAVAQSERAFQYERTEGFLDAVCGRTLVGQGTDTWDPVCQAPAGHPGPCRR